MNTGKWFFFNLSVVFAIVSCCGMVKGDSKGELRVTVQFVSENDNFWKKTPFPRLAQLGPSGHFYSADGMLIKDPQLKVFFENSKDSDKNTPCFLIVALTNEKR